MKFTLKDDLCALEAETFEIQDMSELAEDAPAWSSCSTSSCCGCSSCSCSGTSSSCSTSCNSTSSTSTTSCSG